MAYDIWYMVHNCTVLISAKGPLSLSCCRVARCFVSIAYLGIGQAYKIYMLYAAT